MLWIVAHSGGSPVLAGLPVRRVVGVVGIPFLVGALDSTLGSAKALCLFLSHGWGWVSLVLIPRVVCTQYVGYLLGQVCLQGRTGSASSLAQGLGLVCSRCGFPLVSVLRLNPGVCSETGHSFVLMLGGLWVCRNISLGDECGSAFGMHGCGAVDARRSGCWDSLGNGSLVEARLTVYWNVWLFLNEEGSRVGVS